MSKAVAIRYQEGLPAPFIIAKGKENLAESIVRIAEEHGIMVLPEHELAEALFPLEIGSWIPEELFELVAQILAFVYTVQERHESNTR
jgi:type III secretion system FlhB-like substrate exporter